MSADLIGEDTSHSSSANISISVSADPRARVERPDDGRGVRRRLDPRAGEMVFPMRHPSEKHATKGKRVRGRRVGERRPASSRPGSGRTLRYICSFAENIGSITVDAHKASECVPSFACGADRPRARQPTVRATQTPKSKSERAARHRRSSDSSQRGEETLLDVSGDLLFERLGCELRVRVLEARLLDGRAVHREVIVRGSSASMYGQDGVDAGRLAHGRPPPCACR